MDKFYKLMSEEFNRPMELQPDLQNHIFKSLPITNEERFEILKDLINDKALEDPSDIKENKKND